MKRILFILLLSIFIGKLFAQDTIRTLIISEVRIDAQHNAYLELTNVGSTNINLSKFELGKISPWTMPYKPLNGEWFMLPNKVLAPGKSFVIAKVSDYCTKMWYIEPEKYNKYESKPEFLKLSNLQIHIPETYPLELNDSVSMYYNFVNIWNGSYCWYLRYHISPTDSVVVDQVNGFFDDTDGTNRDVMYDVAGYPNASGNSILIRKSNVTKGNTDFTRSSGRNAAESEWIPIPLLLGNWEPHRAVFWTVGNHGDYHLNSLTSSILNVNWSDSTITVPWGVRNDDSIMYKFNRIPGIAWHYDYNGTYADSAYCSVRTGDKLTVYACGNQVEKITFKLNVLPPTSNDKMVIPKKIPYKNGIYLHAKPFCDVTDNVPGKDTISGIPYACRIDTLFKYLEKPGNANWEIVFVDGLNRADLKKGDKLKVTAANGTIKEYYIKPNKYYPTQNADLSAITWPDIPEVYRGKLGWKGDTIPGFNASKLNYKLTIPWDYEGIPALIATPSNHNANVRVKRAVKVIRDIDAESRTITFTVTAEDSVTVKVYKVELLREWCCHPHQNWKNGEPFISEFVFKQDYQNDFLEIVNPTNTIIDLGNYMVTFGNYANATEAITRKSTSTDWPYRYNKYIPGYNWVDSVVWATTPSSAIKDTHINTLIPPGNVFVMAFINGKPTDITFPKTAASNTDIDFVHNPWGENLKNPWDCALRQWWGQKIMLFKILNDSIKQGLKAANDPNDFKLIDVMGDIAGTRWVVGGKQIDQCISYLRKREIYKGNPVIQSSFGTNLDNCEWKIIDEQHLISFIPLPWPYYRIAIADNIGYHEMNEVTIHKSTITSLVYSVSSGFSNNEKIYGIEAGTNLTNFYSNVIKADTGQHLKVRRFADGTILNGTDVLSTGDTLIVVSADSVNTTKYILDFTPLSNNAILTSATYSINVIGSSGTITNFGYDTDLKTVLEGVVVPAKATIEVIDSKGSYMPLKMCNYKGIYSNIKVNDQIKFIVTAEDGKTKITYRLQPNTLNTDAFVFSNIYNVDQSWMLIDNIPEGTTVETFFKNIIPSTGATLKLVDKNGIERTNGKVYKDDKIIVTAQDGNTKKTYILGYKICPQIMIYLNSAVYNIDQLKLIISGIIKINTTVGEFLSNLTIPEYAKVKVLDKWGNEKLLTDTIKNGDLVLFTYCYGSIVIIYTVDLSSINPFATDKEIMVYPNPAKEILFISGLNAGYKIQVMNPQGKIIINKNKPRETEMVFMGNHPKGIYLIKIIKPGNIEICRKVVLQ